MVLQSAPLCSDKAFLAKNELSHSRWPHSTIEPLFNADGSRFKLFAVKNMELYLTVSRPKSVGTLFTSRNETIFLLSKFICRLVLKSLPIPFL